MDQFNLHNIHLCDSHSPDNAFAVTFVEWNQSRNLYGKKMVNNKRPVASYIFMYADVILEHLLWTMHNGSFKSLSFSTFVLWAQIKTPQENQMEQKEPSSLKFTFGKYSPKVYSRLHSGHYTNLYKVMQTEAAM